MKLGAVPISQKPDLTSVSQLSLKIKAAFFLAGMLGLHGNIRSIISAIKSEQGNVKSPDCQSPSPRWVDCVTYTATRKENTFF